MFDCHFSLYQENDDVLVFRSSKKNFYLNIVIGFGFCVFIIIRWSDASYAILFVYATGFLFLLLGAYPLFFRREITLDKKKKELILTKMTIWWRFKRTVIPFEQIDTIEIRENILGDDSGVSDTIYLNVKGKNKVKLGGSGSEDYSNQFTYTLSDIIGCKVICKR